MRADVLIRLIISPASPMTPSGQVLQLSYGDSDRRCVLFRHTGVSYFTFRAATEQLTSYQRNGETLR
jgi:hypothetical protein